MARLNVYRVMPPDLNTWEQLQKAVLDREFRLTDTHGY